MERPAEAAAARLPVRVAVRARPANSSDGEPCVAVTDNTVVIHSGEEEATFSFDAAFASEKAQHDVYAELVAAQLGGAGVAVTPIGPQRDSTVTALTTND